MDVLDSEYRNELLREMRKAIQAKDAATAITAAEGLEQLADQGASYSLIRMRAVQRVAHVLDISKTLPKVKDKAWLAIADNEITPEPGVGATLAFWGDAFMQAAVHSPAGVDDASRLEIYMTGSELKGFSVMEVTDLATCLPVRLTEDTKSILSRTAENTMRDNKSPVPPVTLIGRNKAGGDVMAVNAARLMRVFRWNTNKFSEEMRDRLIFDKKYLIQRFIDVLRGLPGLHYGYVNVFTRETVNDCLIQACFDALISVNTWQYSLSSDPEIRSRLKPFIDHKPGLDSQHKLREFIATQVNRVIEASALPIRHEK